MTTLRIDLAAYKKACKKIRAERWPEEAGDFAATREYYREDSDFASSIKYSVRPQAAPGPRDMDDILAELHVAALKAQGAGATEKQIQFLAQMAFDADEAGEIIGGGFLTRAEASRLIDAYKRDAK